MVDEIRDHNGHVRKLGWVPPSQERSLLRASRTSIQAYRTQLGLDPLAARSTWVELSAVKGAPLSLIEDQRDYGACTAATATGAGNRQRFLRGEAFEPLSWCWLYDQVNGGKDQGSNIGQANDVVRAQGVPPMSSYAKCTFKKGQNPTGVKWYKEGTQEITFTDFDSIVTGVLMGILVQIPIDAHDGGRFESFDGNGVSKGVGKTPNHSVYVAGLKNIAGQWVLELVNSWGQKWGPFGSGTCYITEKLVNNAADTDDAVGHIVVLEGS